MGYTITSIVDNGDGTSAINIFTDRHNRARFVVAHHRLTSAEVATALGNLATVTDHRDKMLSRANDAPETG